MGYHTITIFKKLTFKEAILLYKHFQAYGELEIYPSSNYRIAPNSSEFIKLLNCGLAQYYKTKYRIKYKGINWTLRISKASPGFISQNDDENKPCSILARINPKVFVGIRDYVATADESDLEMVEINFNNEAERISPILGKFRSYYLNRVDYCINFDLKELDIEYTPEQMMKLIKRSNIPNHYKEWMEYDREAHRRKSGKNSFYLISNSANINCYWKNPQLKNKFIDCPNSEDDSDIIRFEVQCKYLKLYHMTRLMADIKGPGNHINEFLSDKTASIIINEYFNRVIGKGDYYTLRMARKIIEKYKFADKKEQRLISALEFISKCGSVSKAKAAYEGQELEDFRRTLRDLADLNINPVTVPKDWGIKGECMRNLLRSYDDKNPDKDNGFYG